MSQDNMDEMVTRQAPRWAWELIDETLANDAQSTSFDAETRGDVSAAFTAMLVACEDPDLFEVSREEIDRMIAKVMK